MNKLVSILICLFLIDPLYGASRDFERDDPDHIEVTDTATLSDLTGFTLMAWTNFESDSGNRVIISKGDASGNKEYRFRWISFGNSINCHFSTNGSNEVGGSDTPDGDPDSTDSGQWTHFACAWDGSNIRLYENGAQFGTDKTASGTMHDAGVDLRIGDYSDGTASSAFDGNMMDAKIFNRGLSAAEIKESSLCMNYPVSGKIVHFTMIETESNPTFFDHSGNNHTGTNSGTVNSASQPQFFVSNSDRGGVSWCGGSS